MPIQRIIKRNPGFMEYLITNHIYAPYGLSIDVTDQCNFRCCHCYTKHAFNKNSQISFNKLKELFEQGKEMGTTEVCFTGGEVLLRSDIIDILKVANNMGLRTIIKTNAFFLDEEMQKKLEDVGLEEMQISIYGMTDEEYFAVTGSKQEGVSEKIRNISVTKSMIHKLIRFVVLKENYRSMCDYVSWCKESGLPESDYFHILDISPTSAGDTAVTEHALSAKELREFFLLLKKEHQDYFDFICEDIKPYRHCVVCKTGLNIDFTGNVSPCSGFPIVLGNIYESDIKKIWENSEDLKKIQGITKEDFVCDNCFYKNHCTNRCMGSFYEWNNKKNYLIPNESYCEIKKTKAEILNFVINNS